jgi:hypothetical protein
MRRRHLLASMSVGAVSGCLGTFGTGTGSGPNCSDFDRDTTIDEITTEDSGDQLTLAGKITEKREAEEAVLVSDGTGVAKVLVNAGSDGEALLEHPTSECLAFRAAPIATADDEEFDVTMGVGELVSSEA